MKILIEIKSPDEAELFLQLVSGRGATFCTHNEGDYFTIISATEVSESVAEVRNSSRDSKPPSSVRYFKPGPY